MVVGPILNQWRSDVFCDNENGPNFLFKNNGGGTFTDVAQRAGECRVASLRPFSHEERKWFQITKMINSRRPLTPHRGTFL